MAGGIAWPFVTTLHVSWCIMLTLLHRCCTTLAPDAARSALRDAAGRARGGDAGHARRAARGRARRPRCVHVHAHVCVFVWLCGCVFVYSCSCLCAFMLMCVRSCSLHPRGGRLHGRRARAHRGRHQEPGPASKRNLSPDNLPSQLCITPTLDINGTGHSADTVLSGPSWCRGAWARVTIDRFRHSSRSTFKKYRQQNSVSYVLLWSLAAVATAQHYTTSEMLTALDDSPPSTRAHHGAAAAGGARHSARPLVFGPCMGFTM